MPFSGGREVHYRGYNKMTEAWGIKIKEGEEIRKGEGGRRRRSRRRERRRRKKER